MRATRRSPLPTALLLPLALLAWSCGGDDEAAVDDDPEACAYGLEGCRCHLPPNLACVPGLLCDPTSRLCGVPDDTPQLGDMGDGDGDAMGTEPSEDPARTPLDLGFEPSNVADLVTGRTLSTDANIMMRGPDGCPDCTCEGELTLALQSTCAPLNGIPFHLDIEAMEVQTGDGDEPREIALVIFVENLIVRDGAQPRLFHPRGGPVIIVANDTIWLENVWRAPGGYSGAIASNGTANGDGPGGGGYEPGSYGLGEGGAFCTYGGRGPNQPQPGGTTYGKPELAPLQVGSGGGAPYNIQAAEAGDGGGALQLVAGNQIWIGENATLHARGGLGESMTLNGTGGGSGGALLFEAPTVTIEGVLDVRGGIGGGTPEERGYTGGLGWIRINTTDAMPTLGDKSELHPDIDSECTSFGMLN